MGRAAGVLSFFVLASQVVCGAVQAQTPEVITVTTDRTGIPQSRAIESLDWVSPQDLLRVDAQHPAEVLNRQAGVNLHRGNGIEHLTAIRSPVLTGGSGAGSFLYLENGIPLRAAGFANINGLFDAHTDLASAMEIVKGPGSALHGSNALHGLINTRLPDPASAVRRLELEGGSWGRYGARLVLPRPGNMPASYMALSLRREDGWRENASLNRTGALISASGSIGNVDWSGWMSVVALEQETAGFILGPRAYRDRALARRNDDPEAFRDATALRAAVEFQGSLDNAWTWSATPHIRANAMDFRMHFLPSEALERSGHDSAGLLASLSRSTETGRTVLGLDLETTSGWLDEFQERPTIFSYVQGQHYDYAVDAHVGAVYAQQRWQVSDRTVLQAGLRLENTRYRYTNHLPNGIEGRFLRLPDREDAFTTLTPHAGVNWQGRNGQSLHARLARGVRTPQAAELYRLQSHQIIDDIKPETLDSAEIGLNLPLGGQGQAGLTIYEMRKRNVFFRDADGFNVTDGRTRHTGVEFDLGYQINDSVAMELAGSWAIHSYDFDRVVSRSSDVISVGNDVDTAPRWTWNALLMWTPIPNSELALSWAHVGEYFTNAANTQAYDGHDVVDVRGRYRLSPRMEIHAAVRNLFDTAYAERADYAFGSERYFPGEPRGLTIGLRWTG